MYQIYKSTKSLFDIDEIADYIAQDSFEYAMKFLEQVNKTLEALSAMPFIGRVEQSYAQVLAEIRSIGVQKFANYRIYYSLEQNKITAL